MFTAKFVSEHRRLLGVGARGASILKGSAPLGTSACGKPQLTAALEGFRPTKSLET